MKKLIALVFISMSLIGTSAFASSIGTSADSTISKDFTQSVGKVLYPTLANSDRSKYKRCMKKQLPRCRQVRDKRKCVEKAKRFCKKRAS